MDGLDVVRKLQTVAQAGLTYSDGPFDRERYETLLLEGGEARTSLETTEVAFACWSTRETGRCRQISTEGRVAPVGFGRLPPMSLFDKVLSGGTGLQAGDPAPEIELNDQDGDKVSLADFRGERNVVLFFYPKDETPGCIKEVCAFRDDYEAFQEIGAEVLGVSSDSEASHDRFAKHHGLPFRLLADVDGRARAAFKVPSNLGVLPGRVTYVIDKQGRIAHAFNSQTNPKRHVTEALEVLRRLG
jgi:peroxiredoxin Q/BCP